MTTTTDGPSYGSRVVLGGVPFDEAVAAVRQALATQGVGVLTEIDVRATLKSKLDVDVPDQIILGACNPPAAHAALQAEPSVGLLLPCNVVVRVDDGTTLVEAVDPNALVGWTGNEHLQPIAADVAERLRAALAVVERGGTGR